MNRHKHDGEKVIVTYNDNPSKCCNGMKGLLSITESMAFVDFGDNVCSEGHIGIMLPYPFENYYELEEPNEKDSNG